MSAVRALFAAVGLVVALVAAGCGGGSDATSTTTTTSPTTTTTPPPNTTTVRVYFLRNGQVWPVAREIGQTEAVATAALAALAKKPTGAESSDLQVSTAIPDSNRSVERLEIDKGTGIARYSPASKLSKPALAQVVYTLTQFPTLKTVEIDGKHYTRADFEDQTPPILVESPLSGETVSSPIRVTGTANTFEATFQYELRGPDEKILSKHFEMATSGSGTRGTFDFSVPYTLDKDGPGKLVVYEDSAENGARIHVQEIPLVLSP